MPTTRRKPRQEERQAEDLAAGAPLFKQGVPEFDHVAVQRVAPHEDAGYLGRMDKTITEDDVRGQYGGGKYKLTPRDSGGQYINGLGTTTIEISGDPVFKSEAARKLYNRNRGIEEPKAGPAAAAAPAGPSLIELMMFMEKGSERARLEAREQAAQREREAAAAHERQLALVKADGERREKELQAERERLAAQLAADRQRDQQFMQTMISIVKGEARAAAGSGDTLEQAAKLIGIVKELGGGGEGGDEDPMSHLTRNLPAIMQQLRLMSPGAAPAAGPKKAGGAEPLTIEGPLGAEASKVFKEIADRGGDPSLVFAQVLQGLRKKLAAAPATTNGKEQPNGEAAPAAPAAAPRKTARPKTTGRPKAATR